MLAFFSCLNKGRAVPVGRHGAGAPFCMDRRGEESNMRNKAKRLWRPAAGRRPVPDPAAHGGVGSGGK